MNCIEVFSFIYALRLRFVFFEFGPSIHRRDRKLDCAFSLAQRLVNKFDR